ncbi:GtrA family protein [Streptomyces sp. NPDC007264]|uniref:GtrA family protein n=1 Tax=Streptomyces sp. NPDC007264 TaxID=3364777 RepID=UPI0036D8DFFE
MRTAKARPMARQMLVFAAVGVINTMTYYGLYLLFLARLPYLAAHILAFAVSMTGSFFLNARFTYRTRPTWRKFLLFPLTNATNFVVTTAGVYAVVDVLHAGSRLAPLLASAAAIPVTFVVSRTIMLEPARRGGGPGGAPATGRERVGRR